eukprot:scaffold27928_cov115-Isochrysis_galbana.AAC.6
MADGKGLETRALAYEHFAVQLELELPWGASLKLPTSTMSGLSPGVQPAIPLALALLHLAVGCAK